jgi:hypothetical protein
MKRATDRSVAIVSRGRRWLPLVAGAVAIAIAAILGLIYLRQPPKIPASQLRYLQLLSTAISSEDSQQVARIGGLLKGQHEAKELSDRQWSEFQEILDRVNRREWEQAMEACERFKWAQGN